MPGMIFIEFLWSDSIWSNFVAKLRKKNALENGFYRFGLYIFFVIITGGVRLILFQTRDSFKWDGVPEFVISAALRIVT